MAITTITKNADGSKTEVVSYEGRVLSTDRRVVQEMSDVWGDHDFATLVEADGSLKEIDLSGYYGDNSYKTAKVDVGEELRAKLREHASRLGKALDRVRNAEQAVKKFVKQTYFPKGTEVIVRRGRKVPQGTTGVIIWIGESTFGRKTTIRCGVKDAAGTAHWTAMANCDLLETAEQEKARIAAHCAAEVERNEALTAYENVRAERFDALALVGAEEFVLGLA